MQKCTKQKKKNRKYTVKGVKGPCVLEKLPGFDCIWGFPYDYMHGVLLGVTRQIWNVWSKNFLSPNQHKLINKRLLEIKPPLEIHRTPRLLKEKSKWKASEWRSWLLFYSIPCLSGILDDELLNSFKLLVKSIYRLLTAKITEAELFQCEYDLLLFVNDSQRLYGPQFMTFNVHILLHAVDSVRNNGPLWATSTFGFESNLFYYKNDITGPKGVLDQIINRALRRNCFQNILSNSPDSASWNFCRTMFYERREVIMNFTKVNDGSLLFEDKSTTAKLYNRCV